MNHRKSSSLLLAAAVLLTASCDTIGPIPTAPQSSGSADFSVVAAVGSGLTAGFQSRGLVGRHQTHSYVSVFAQAAGARPLDLPLVNGDGIPPLFEIKHLYPPPVLIAPISSTFFFAFHALVRMSIEYDESE